MNGDEDIMYALAFIYYHSASVFILICSSLMDNPFHALCVKLVCKYCLS